MVISFLQEKGGAGKTTLSINIAHAIKELGHSVLVVDSDPQRSALDWHEANGGETLDIISLDRPTLDKDIRRYGRGYKYIIIDGAAKLSDVVVKIITISDLVLIPVQPSPLDLWATDNTIQLVRQRREIARSKPDAAFVISRRVTGTNIGDEFRDVLKEYNLDILDHGTFQRVAYLESIAAGKTVLHDDNAKNRPAAAEIKALANEILGRLNG